jgi:hypothetical protein
LNARIVRTEASVATSFSDANAPLAAAIRASTAAAATGLRIIFDIVIGSSLKIRFYSLDVEGYLTTKMS